jgi:hypothetical protein
MAEPRPDPIMAGWSGRPIGIDTRVSAGTGTESEWREEVRVWKSIGVTHLSLANYCESGHLHRIAGRSLSDHIAAMRREASATAEGESRCADRPLHS